MGVNGFSPIFLHLRWFVGAWRIESCERSKSSGSYETPVSIIYAVYEATTQLLAACLAPAKVVFFIDSQAAISPLSSNTPMDCLSSNQCRSKFAEPISYEEYYVHTYIDKCTVLNQNTKDLVRPWKTLVPVRPIPRHLERAAADARFRLTTRHDFLGVFLYWLGWLLTRPVRFAPRQD
ncbi:reverse transcriptase [Trichonephila clavipes]|nr:reverse transcriptase [Trichonephila clavipes]